ncbi:MAG: S-layer homology domain-containing protein [Clostridia bacterium]|nr:S-layer homology domain-containing protein [Clostridia bacterium]
MNRARLHIYKFVDENTTFYGRLNNMDASWARFQITTMLPYDIQFRVGRFNVDWEGDLGFYNGMDINNDATFGDFDTTGFQFQKTWGMFTGTAVVGRGSDLDAIDDQIGTLGDNDYMTYAVKLHGDFSERFRGGLMGYWLNGDRNLAESVNTYGVYAGFDFTPAVTLQGIYYFQNIDYPIVDDSPKSWKAQLIMKQDLLKFTSLWIEYAQEDNTFLGNNLAGITYNWIGANPTSAGKLAAAALNPGGTSTYWLIRADQKWNDKWSTFLRYAQFDFDVTGMDETKNWSVGASYQYTPAINFRLAYDNIDYGDNSVFGLANGDGQDHVISFRTTVNF